MHMVRAHRLGEDSTFVGQACALCKQEFGAGDVIVICPEDGSRHHDHCWRANGNRCTAYGCTGNGEIGFSTRTPQRQPAPPRPQPTIIPNPAARGQAPSAPPGSKMRVFPSRNLGCARSCLFLAVLLIVLLGAAACFGLYTVADAIMREVSSLDFASIQPIVGALHDSQLLSSGLLA